jgi:hypothetical protein
MSCQEDWQAISYRIKSLLQAGQFHLQGQAIRASDSYGGRKQLLDQTADIYSELESFFKCFEQNTPARARVALDRFINNCRSLFTATGGDAGLQHQRLNATLTMLAALDSELTFLLSDRQENIRRRSERAFTHLQRLIVADPDVREKWQKAFEKGETECEKLGAAHLLHHGIWAFKANAEGARTDLVFGELLVSFDEVERSSEGLVLTEWKLSRKESEGANKFVEAREQATRYACGMLAGIELASYRFVIVVSKRRVEPPADIVSNGVTYRHVNIPVNPQSPSKS